MCFELSKNKKYHIFDTITMNNLIRKTPATKKYLAINKGDDCTTVRDMTNFLSASLSCTFSSNMIVTTLPLKSVAPGAGVDEIMTGGLRSRGPPVGVPGLAHPHAREARNASGAAAWPSWRMSEAGLKTLALFFLVAKIFKKAQAGGGRRAIRAGQSRPSGLRSRPGCLWVARPCAP